MNTYLEAFQRLLSDDVFAEGASASDVRFLWRRLAMTEEVRAVSRALASEPDRIRELCAFIEAILKEDYDKTYRHPHDIAICAALVVLERSPLPCVRGLFFRLQKAKEPSLAWIQRMAEYCEERFVPSTRTSIEWPGARRLRALLPAEETPGIHFADIEMQTSRESLKVVA